MRLILFSIGILPVTSMWHFFFYQSYVEEFENFIEKYNKTYATWDQYLKAYDIFEENYVHVKNMNYKLDSFQLKINEFGDMDPYDFHLNKKGLYNSSTRRTSSCDSFYSTNISLPDSIDWRTSAVTPVKNQGQCGSCWSFSATGAMEGAWAIETGELLTLSEQQLIDCSKKYGDFGCNGGLMDNAFDYAIDNGMCSESGDPYEAKADTCIDCQVVAKFTDCIDVSSGNELELKEAVSRGPVSVAIEADTKVFQFYSSGVITSESCGESLDHGVLIVGYGEEQGQKYWLVKNSWGTSWGDEGYVKIARTDGSSDSGVCGIALQASYPVV